MTPNQLIALIYAGIAIAALAALRMVSRRPSTDSSSKVTPARESRRSRPHEDADTLQYSLAKPKEAIAEGVSTSENLVQSAFEAANEGQILKPAAVPEKVPVMAAAERTTSGTSGPADGSSRWFYAPKPSSDHSSWRDHPLFVDPSGTYSDQTATLPRVFPEEVPGVRTDDYWAGRGATTALSSLMPTSAAGQEDVREDLLAAGYFQPHALSNFNAIRYIAILLPLLLCGVALVLVPTRLEMYVIALIVMLPILGWALPRLYLRNKATERRRQIERAMPDLLDMMNMCVSQGMTVPAALDRVRTEMRGAYPALEQELRIIGEQSRLGSMDVALKNFSRRVNVPEVHSFTSLLMQTSRMGTSVSQSLSDYSDTMRESFKQRADEKGNRATFRLLFPTVLCLMPAVYMFLMGPAVIELSRFFNSGGTNNLDQGSQVIQRLNNQNRARVNDRNNAPRQAL